MGKEKNQHMLQEDKEQSMKCLEQSDAINPVAYADIILELRPEDVIEAAKAEQQTSAQSSWANRCGAEMDQWEQERNQRFEDFFQAKAVPDEARCTHCKQRATCLCLDCNKTYTCMPCDDEIHRWQPLHRRFSWVAGFLAPLKPRETVTDTGEIVGKGCSIPLQSCSTCNKCGDLLVHRAISTSGIIVITEKGRLDLCLPVWWCETCQTRQNPSDADLMASGYFRGTPSLITTIFSVDVLHMWRNLKCLSPGTSLAAFAMAIEKLGRLRGTTAPVDPLRFQKAYSEWSYMTFEARRVVGHDDLQCDACGPTPMCVHVDGNSKLYRFKSAGSNTENQSERRPYHENTCIARKEDVDAHVERLSKIGKVSNLCGTSAWAAARNSGVTTAKRSQDVTGLCLATCRHSVVLAALDMFRGEIFAYAHFLHQFRFAGVRFFAYDVVCQYWKWLEDVRRRNMSEFSHQSRPYLSVMHATGHSYDCQITFGGFWQEGSGWSVMETTEIANAHLSRAGNTTKHMTRAQRTDELTDQILYWNVQRRERMMALLRRRRTRMEAQIRILEGELGAALARFGMTDDIVPQYVEELRTLASSLKANARSAGIATDRVRDGLKLLSASIRAKTRMIKRDVDTAKERMRLRRLRRAEAKRLTRLLRTYEELTGVLIPEEKALNGEFPWAMASEDGSDLANKRVVCDLYMRLSRTREELHILEEEMARLEERQKERLAYMADQMACIDDLLAIPESERPALGSPSHRYELVRPSDGVLAGLRAVFAETSADLHPMAT